MLKQRIITAIILGPLFFAALLWLPLNVFVLVIAGLFLAIGWEYSALIGTAVYWQRWAYLLSLAVLMMIVYQQTFVDAPDAPVTSYWMLISSLFWLLVLLLLIAYQRRQSNQFIHPGLVACFGVFIVITPWLAFVLLRTISAYLLVSVVVLVWLADTGAYCFGRWLGQAKLAAKISPGKTWAGVFGALACCLLYSLLILTQTELWPFSVIIGLALTAVLVLISIVGDLLASALKRQSKLKDTGGLLPGHGGLYDRFDSITAALPVFSFVWLWLGGG